MNYQNNKVGHTNVTTLGKLSGPLVTQGKRTLKNLGTQINWDEGDINFIALLTQKVPNTRGNILCSLKTLSGYEKPLEPSYFLCHVRAEQQWKGQQWCLMSEGKAGEAPGSTRTWRAVREGSPDTARLLTPVNWSGHPVEQELNTEQTQNAPKELIC